MVPTSVDLRVDAHKPTVLQCAVYVIGKYCLEVTTSSLVVLLYMVSSLQQQHTVAQLQPCASQPSKQGSRPLSNAEYDCMNITRITG
jgi:hypothetical protein